MPVRFAMPVLNAATCWTTLVCSRQCWNFAGDPPGKEPSGPAVMNMTSRSGSGNGTGFSSTELTTEKIAVFAPIPSARAATAAKLKPGLCQTIRSEWLRSLRTQFTEGLDCSPNARASP